MRHLSIFFVLLSAFFITPFKTLLPEARAQGWSWGRTTTGAGVDSWPVVTDPSGNVYGAGLGLDFSIPAVFGTHSVAPHAGGTGYQTLWVKYDPSGNVIYADGTSAGNTWIMNIATDRSGNFFVYGTFSSDTMKIGPFVLKNTIPGGFGTQYFLAKINPAGTVLWAVNDGSGITNYVYAGGVSILGGGGVTTDATGNVYICGSYNEKKMTIGSTTLTNADPIGSTTDIFVAKYSPSGIPLWATSVGGTDYDYGVSVVESSTGYIYVGGSLSSKTMTVGATVLSDPSGIDMALLTKFTSSTGTPVWADNGVDTKQSTITGLARDKSGNVYATGGFEGATIKFAGTTVTRAYSPGGNPLALFLVRYNPSGAITWSKTISSKSSGVWGYCIALASCGQVWVSGNYTDDAVIAPGDTLKKLTGSPFPDPIFIAGYDLPTGSPVGYSGLLSGGDDQNGIACDAAGNVFTCSDYMNSLPVGKDTLPAQSGSEFFYMAKYSNVIKQDTIINSKNVVLCNDSADIYAPPGYLSYVWEDGSEDSTRRVATGGIYFVAGFNCGQPVTIDTYHVSMAIGDTVSYVHTSTFCSNPSAIPFTLLATSGDTAWAWSTGATTVSTTVNVTVAGTYTYYVVGKNVCDAIIDTFKILVNPSPVVSLGNDTFLCAGDMHTLRSIQPAGSTYLWSTGSTDDTIRIYGSSTPYILHVTFPATGCIGSDTINVIKVPLPVVDLGPDLFNCNGISDTLRSSIPYTAPTYLWNDASTGATDIVKVTGTYWLQVTVNGCKSADTINTVIIYDTLNFYNHDTAICRGSIVAAFVTGDPGQTYQWRPTAGIALSTTINPVILADTSATYTLTTSMPLCPDRIDSFHLDVQPNPTVYIGDNRMVCQFDSLRIIATVKPNWYTHYIYNWSPTTFLDNSTTNAVTFTAGNYTQLMLTVSTPAGCAGKDSAELIVRPGNFADMKTVFDICPHDSVQFKPTGGIAYEWHPGIYLDDSFAMAPIVKAITSQQYRMIATSLYGCKDTFSVRVNVHPAAVLNLGNTATIYPGQSYHITPQTNCTHFAWTPATGLDNAYVSDPVAKPEVNTRYIVRAANEWGCKVTDSIDIQVEPGTLLALPNAFTPGSGSNSKFFVIKNGIADLKYFRIFNRWGNKVFETTSIDQGWDGTFNGVPQPFGVYVYEVGAVTSQGKNFEKHGNVTLIR